MLEKKEGESQGLSEEQYKKLISGDPSAWQDLVESKTKILMGNLQRRFLCSEDRAQEINQKVFCAIWTSLPELRELSRFDGWFWKIAERTAKKVIYGKKKDVSFLPMEDQDFCSPDFEPWEYMQAQELRLWLAQHLNILTKEQIPVFVLHFYEHLSNSDIAALLGKNVKLVNVHLSKARKGLREAFEKGHV